MSAILSTCQRAGTTCFVMFLTFGPAPALIATITSLGFDAVNDKDLCSAWLSMAQLAASRACPAKLNEKERHVAKREMPGPVFGAPKAE